MFGFNPWFGKIPWRREWQPTPVFLPGKSYGQRSLAGYSPWGHEESDMTESLNHHQEVVFRLIWSGAGAHSYFQAPQVLLTCIQN